VSAEQRWRRIDLIEYIKYSIAEIEEAEELARKIGKGRAYIGVSGGIMIEVSLEEALEYMERRKRALRALLERLKEEARRESAAAQPAGRRG